ncbi:MAG TPA: hypothetical protein VF601_06620 [Beijerinckiaceae bacterium]|jgi:hypothetical protein
MSLRFLVAVILALGLIVPGAAFSQPTARATTVKSSKSNTSDRTRAAPKAKARGTIVKSKSNITNN